MSLLARSTMLRHPSGATFETPLLVPSFSSKGFGVLREPDSAGVRRERSEILEIYQVAVELLTDCMLVSAYDLYHANVPFPERAIAELTVVDSGGYETSDVQDLSGIYAHGANPKDWDAGKHEEVLAAWPGHIPAIFVSYDSPHEFLSLSSQIDRALTLRAKHRNQLFALLLKPSTKDQKYIQIRELVAAADELGGFDVLGVTEKELGNSCLERMVNIGKLRLALDDANVASPLHIFGSLDPISVPLYLLAGAEIFDGLTWLRYGYDEGAALYRHNVAARRIGIDRRDDFIKLKVMQDNLGHLTDLRNTIRRFLNDRDFAKFGPNQDLLRVSLELLRTKLPRAA